ncbi:MAG TPA: hypothetical protein EYQ12_02265 [Oceanospirillaceae bacterium]|jgi:hypothetical protein|nr:hypothetical protein [Oceanospirillaceae bacterium]
MLWSNWSIGTQTFWAMFAASNSLLLLGSLALSNGLLDAQQQQLDEVQQALQLALQKYRQYCASPELLSAVMRLRKITKEATAITHIQRYWLNCS